MSPRKRRFENVDGTLERTISEAYPVIDNDLARDNIENDLPFAELEDL